MEEIPIGLNARENEVFRRFPENRLPLFRVSVQQRPATPAVQTRGQLPAEIDNIVEPIVEAVAAIGRMAVRGISGDEDATDPVFVGDRNAQVPEAYIVELAFELESRRLLHEPEAVVVVLRGVVRHRRMKEEGILRVDPAEKPPVALELRVHRPIGGARWKSFQACFKLR